MMETKNDLKSCPLCGSKNIGVIIENEGVVSYSLYAKCCTCELTAHKDYAKEKPLEDAKKELTEYWNHRVPITKSKEEFNPHNTVIGKRIDAGFID
jgi:formate dehydrogenase maturation protein FdhE